MAAIRREIKDLERQFDEADKEYAEVSKKLKDITQERANVEEELISSNVRLKQLMGELHAQKQLTDQQEKIVVADSRMTMDELSRKVETALLQVLEERFRGARGVAVRLEEGLPKFQAIL
jgi:predicted  nucleic acid-binding Zn-ribbon protein